MFLENDDRVKKFLNGDNEMAKRGSRLDTLQNVLEECQTLGHLKDLAKEMKKRAKIQPRRQLVELLIFVCESS